MEQFAGVLYIHVHGPTHPDHNMKLLTIFITGRDIKLVEVHLLLAEPEDVHGVLHELVVVFSCWVPHQLSRYQPFCLRSGLNIKIRTCEKECCCLVVSTVKRRSCAKIRIDLNSSVSIHSVVGELVALLGDVEE